MKQNLQNIRFTFDLVPLLVIDFRKEMVCCYQEELQRRLQLLMSKCLIIWLYYNNPLKVSIKNREIFSDGLSAGIQNEACRLTKTFNTRMRFPCSTYPI